MRGLTIKVAQPEKCISRVKINQMTKKISLCPFIILSERSRVEAADGGGGVEKERGGSLHKQDLATDVLEFKEFKRGVCE